MIATKRERIILLVALGSIGLFVLNWVALTPLLERRAAASVELSKVTAELENSQSLHDNRPRFEQRWSGMLAAGLKSDVSESESQALRALNDWAQDSGMALMSLQPDRVDASKQQKDFQQLTLRVSGTGSVRSLTRFLWSIQNATIPLRVTDVQVSARKEGTDDLVMTLAVSTLSLAPAAPAKPGAVKVAEVAK